MACSRPVLAMTEHDSDLASIVEQANCGIVIPPGSSEKLAKTILEAYNNQGQWRKMGRLGREHVELNYSRQEITKKYHNLIQKLDIQL